MAGRGSRLRPHSLTVPKPLIPIAGQPIVHRLVKDIAGVLKQQVEEVAFILGDPAFFGEDVVESLKELGKELGAKVSIYRQGEPLGTGHAIMSAKDSLSGPAVVAYADTLFKADFELDPTADAVIWTKNVENPEAYGVVKLNANDEITELVEKPIEFVSNQAVIGIYYFKDVAVLKDKLQEVLNENLMHGGEYQINDGIKKMMADGRVFKTGTVDGWFDCGNKKITVETNQKVLDLEKGKDLVHNSAIVQNSIIVEPCFIGEGVVIKNSVVGPHVSIGNGTQVDSSVIKNTIIQEKTMIKHANLTDSMIGNHAHYNGGQHDVSLGDYSVID